MLAPFSLPQSDRCQFYTQHQDLKVISLVSAEMYWSNWEKNSAPGIWASFDIRRYTYPVSLVGESKITCHTHFDLWLQQNAFEVLQLGENEES